MTNKKSQIGNVAQGMDKFIMILFIVGVFIVIALFAYVLGVEHIAGR